MSPPTTTGGKDEPNIDFMRKSQRASQHGSRSVKTNNMQHIGGVMVSMLASSVVDHGYKPQTGQTKDCRIGNCCFSANHAAKMRKNKDLSD